MSNVNVTKSGPEVFQDNETGYHDSFTHGRDYRPPYPKPIDFRVYAVWAIAVPGTFAVFWIFYAIWKFFYCRDGAHYIACDRLDTVEPFIFLAAFLVPLALMSINVLLRIWTRTRYENALANRANLILNRYGDNEPADLFDRLTLAENIRLLNTRYESALVLERAIAAHKIYRGVNALSLASTSNTEQNLLDSPVAGANVPLSHNQWLPIANEQPHIMLAGSTGEGKTVTAKAILWPRLQSGKEYLFVIDPHSSNWYGLAGRGGGEDWDDCKVAINELFLEYKSRINERHQYLLLTGEELAEDHFDRLNVLIDEAFLIKQNLDKGKVQNPWTLLVEIMSSGARKIGISLILLTQTGNVEDLGLSGPLRKNFFRIALDPQAIKLMIAKEETAHDRKQQLYEGLNGLQYPATAEINGQIHLLDRLGLLPMAQAPVGTNLRVWVPPSVRPSVSYGSVASGQAVSRGRTDGLIAELVALRRKEISRDEARNVYGLEFTNSDWTAAGAILANEKQG